MPLVSRDDGTLIWGWLCCRHVLCALAERSWQRDTLLLSRSNSPRFVCPACEPEARTHVVDEYTNDEACEDQEVIMATYDATHPGERLFGIIEKWGADGCKPLRLP